MSDLPLPPRPVLDPDAGSASAGAGAGSVPATGDLEVDLAAFLPEGTVLEVASEPVSEPGSEPAVDLAALTRIEADLAAVDEALLALDAGDPTRSPLLAELLATPPSTP